MTVLQQSSYSPGQQILLFHASRLFTNGHTKDLREAYPEELQFSQASHTQDPNLMSVCSRYDLTQNLLKSERRLL
jgi:hypothetical protein